MKKIEFFDQNGSFHMDQPENYSYLYFPIAGEKGLKASVGPNLSGDSKLNQNAFVLEPVSAENLHSNRNVRNFWCHVEGAGYWSASGTSAEAELNKFTKQQEKSCLDAGFMWHRMTRESEKYGLKSVITSFVPVWDNVEIMLVELTNQRDENLTFTPFTAIPLYGRSADNLRDHRHVTSLLHRIHAEDGCVRVKPTLSFDERGHRKNELTYFVAASTGEGEKPEGYFPTVDLFLGEGGTWLNPKAVRDCEEGVTEGADYAGKEAVGAMRFGKVTLKPGEKACYIVRIGVTESDEELQESAGKYNTLPVVQKALEETKAYWTEKVNVAYHTGSKEFDQYMKWISFQPILRRIYGCSFLPHHDYGKGGRGWRDLWQDCLALLIMNPDGVRRMILDNYGGVRMDGTNATIIGTKPGEFVADRNNITRVWMDHGFWPFLTTRLYLDQTGDYQILGEQVTYFKDAQVQRGTAKDEQWNREYGMQQKTTDGHVYEGTVLEHILLQNLCACLEVGDHNEIRLRGADWNDALDMAWEKGESVAFTCAYAGNLADIAQILEQYADRCGVQEIAMAEEMKPLLDDSANLFYDINAKRSVLEAYGKTCAHEISGKKITVSVSELARILRTKSSLMGEQIRNREFVSDREGNGWFNGYYDNHGRQVEGLIDGTVRMMLTGQVFSIMSGVASREQVAAITKSADRYLYRREAGGYRLNTDFGEEKYDMGRMFGFSYGDKENGAVFSHMTVMYANALYRRGFYKEGHKAIQTLLEAAMNFDTGRIYPGVPEYFNAEGRGMYHYLTGAASWYMLTVVTAIFGVRGENGDLIIAPALMKEQFDENGMASLEMTFQGKKLKVCIHNPENREPWEYRVIDVQAGDLKAELTSDGKACIGREELLLSDADIIEIKVTLGEK